MKPTQHHFSVPQFQLHIELELQIYNMAALPWRHLIGVKISHFQTSTQ